MRSLTKTLDAILNQFDNDTPELKIQQRRDFTTDEARKCIDYANVAFGIVGYLWSVPINHQYYLSDPTQFTGVPIKLLLEWARPYPSPNDKKAFIRPLDSTINNNPWLCTSATNLALIHPRTQGFMLRSSLQYLMPNPAISDWHFRLSPDSEPVLLTLPNYDYYRQHIDTHTASVTSNSVHVSTAFLTGAMRIRPGLVVWEAQTSIEYSISIMVVDGDGGRPFGVHLEGHTVADASFVKPNANSGSHHTKVAHLGRNLTPSQKTKKQHKRASNRNRDMIPRAPRKAGNSHKDKVQHQTNMLDGDDDDQSPKRSNQPSLKRNRNDLDDDLKQTQRGL
jgi:hypothetical protein